MSSSIDLTDGSEARDLSDMSEDAAHKYLQMSCSRDLTDVTLVSEDEMMMVMMTVHDDDGDGDNDDERL